MRCATQAIAIVTVGQARERSGFLQSARIAAPRMIPQRYSCVYVCVKKANSAHSPVRDFGINLLSYDHRLVADEATLAVPSTFTA